MKKGKPLVEVFAEEEATIIIKKRTRDPYDYVSDALDKLFLLRQRCQISVRSEGLLDKAEVALTELLDSVNPEVRK